MLLFFKGVITYLLNNEEFKVGRKQADVLINNDKSVSRLHSLLLLKVCMKIYIMCFS